MDKLEVFALDANRNRLTASIPYKSLNWHRCYYEPGDFMIEVPRSVYSPEWKYIYTNQRPETGEIQKVEVRDGENGWEDVVVLSGFFEEGVLNRRCFLNQYEGGLESADNVQTVQNWLRSYLPDDVDVLETEIDGVSKTLDPSFQLLGDTAFAELQTVGASVRIGYDFEANKRTAQIWQGLDRTQSQGGTPEPVEPIWVTTGKVQSATLDAMPNTPVGRTIIYGASQPGQGRLPEGYTELEYIESTGTQCIDTGFAPNNNTRAVADLELMSDITETFAVFGGRTSASKNSFCMWVVAGEFRTDFGSNNLLTSSVANKGRYYIDKNKASVTINGIEENNNPSTFQSDNAMAIFTVKETSPNSGVENGFDERMISARLYSFTIFDDGEKIRDLVPCETVNGEVGMYDLVGSKFYGNSGTGAFIAGPEIIIPDEPMTEVGLSIGGEKWSIDLGGNTLGEGHVLTIDSDGTAKIEASRLPEGYTELEYIESAEKSWLDTGFYPTNNTSFELDAHILDQDSGEHHIMTVNTPDYFALKLSSNLTNYQARWGNQELKEIAHSGQLYSRHLFKGDKGTYSIDGGAKTTYSPNTFTQTLSLALFANRISTGAQQFTNARAYSLKIWENDVLERDFVPCRNASGTVGMYDLVGSKFYGNSGTGSFLAGPEKETVIEIPTQTMPNVPARNTQVITDSSFPHYFDLEYQQYQESVVTGNPWVVFADTWGNLSGYSASVDSSNYRNTCYVLYEYEEPIWQSNGEPRLDPVYAYEDVTDESGIVIDAVPVVQGYTIKYETKRGYVKARLNDGLSEDIETFIDARNEKPSFDSEWSREMYAVGEELDFPSGMKESYDAYPSSLMQQGLDLLANDYQLARELDAGEIDADRYTIDYDLGDKIDTEISSIGLKMEARIIEADEVYDNNGASVAIALGDRKVRRANGRG